MQPQALKLKATTLEKSKYFIPRHMQPQALKLQATMLENEGPHCRKVEILHPSAHATTSTEVTSHNA